MIFKSKIIEIIQQTPRVKVFRLEKPEGFDFVPGQFVMLSVDGLLTDRGISVKRSYSVASSPSASYIEVCITKAENGVFSVEMHQKKIGDIVNVNGPYGIFRLKEILPAGTIFVAGGSGIAPIIGMIRTLMERGDEQLTLFYGFRSPQEFIYEDELEFYEKEGRLVLHATVDTPADGWSKDTGFVPDILEKYVSEKSDAYLCGPPPMVNATIRKLVSIGYKEPSIFREQW